MQSFFGSMWSHNPKLVPPMYTDAIQYGLGSVTVMARTGNIYLNFVLWAVSLVPAWLVVSKIGVTLGDQKIAREEAVQEDVVGSSQGSVGETKQ